jgi:hypothetical protein
VIWLEIVALGSKRVVSGGRKVDEAEVVRACRVRIEETCHHFCKGEKKFLQRGLRKSKLKI